VVFRRNFKKHKDSDTDVCHIAASRSSPGKYNTIARLFELMKIISDDQLLILLKDLLKDSLTNHISSIPERFLKKAYFSRFHKVFYRFVVAEYSFIILFVIIISIKIKD